MSIPKLIRILADMGSPESIGRQGENGISRKLAWSNFFGRKGLLLRNIYIPKQNGGTSEIDLLYITEKGIFVIESKNYSGYVFGSEESKNWSVTLYAGKDFWGRKKVEKHKFYNPIMQNASHVKQLLAFLHEAFPIYSIIVFSDRCRLMDVTWHAPNTFVCKKCELNGIIARIWRQSLSCLSDDQIQGIYARLLPLTNVATEVKQQHVADIQKKMETCPVCGGRLVLRTAKQGNNVGGRFYGCSNYPRCKFTRSI